MKTTNPKTVNTNNTKTKKPKSWLQDLIETIVISGLLAAFIIIFIAQSFIVDGSSMEPTLHEGERLLVNKFLYRFTEPDRGDVIVFKPQGAPKNKYIKRVIGLPGDTITIENGQVMVNGEVIDEKYTAVPINEDYGTYKVPEGFFFVLGDNRFPNASADSRFPNPVGYVNKNSISGKAFVVYWPLFKIRWISGPEYSNLTD